MKHILVTGGGGYIGSFLVSNLLTQGYKVRVFDSFYFGKESLKNLKGPLEIVEGDIREIQLSALHEIDAVIHLAAFSNDLMANVFPQLTYEVNTLATERLAQLAKQARVQRFIFASSASIYHTDKKIKGGHTETDLVKPEGHYSVSKHLAEKKVLAEADEAFKVIVFRMATVNGVSPRMRFDLVINAMTKSALERGKIFVFSGHQSRPVIDIRDVVRAYLLALTCTFDTTVQPIFNIAYKNYTILQLAREVTRCLAKSGISTSLICSNPKQKSKTYSVSTKKIYNAFNFTALFSPSDTIKELVKRFKKHIPSPPANTTSSASNTTYKLHSLLTQTPLKYV